jgi:IS30 family transposase
LAHRKYIQKLRDKRRANKFTDEVRKHGDTKLEQKWIPEQICHTPVPDGLSIVSPKKNQFLNSFKRRSKES